MKLACFWLALCLTGNVKNDGFHSSFNMSFKTLILHNHDYATEINLSPLREARPSLNSHVSSDSIQQPTSAFPTTADPAWVCTVNTEVKTDALSLQLLSQYKFSWWGMLPSSKVYPHLIPPLPQHTHTYTLYSLRSDPAPLHFKKKKNRGVGGKTIILIFP